MRRDKWRVTRRHHEARTPFQSVVRRLFNLMGGAEAADWELVLNSESMSSRVLMLDYDMKECIHAPVDVIPWPIMFVAARYSLKHLLTGRQKPSAQVMTKFTTNFTNRVLWHWSLQDEECALAPLRLKHRNDVLSYSGKIPPPGLLAWCRTFRRKTTETAEYAAWNDKTMWCNTLPLVPFAARILRQSNVCLLPNGKDGGWSIILRSLRPSLDMDILGGSMYTKVAADDYDLLVQQTRRESLGLARRIAKVEEMDGTVGVMMKSWKNSSIVATLNATVKSHKSAGEVSLRAIHGGAPSSLASWSIWLSNQLRPLLQDLPHLIKDSRSMVRHIRTLEKKFQGSLLVQIDLKDFYLSGSVESIIEELGEGFSGERRSLVKDVGRVLLQNQYVKSKFFPDKMWKVVQGSGIGLIHSGDTMDWAFYSAVERWILQEEFMDQ